MGLERRQGLGRAVVRLEQPRHERLDRANLLNAGPRVSATPNGRWSSARQRRLQVKTVWVLWWELTSRCGKASFNKAAKWCCRKTVLFS